MATTAAIVGVFVGQPAPIGEVRGRPVVSAIAKAPVTTAWLDLSTTNLAGDRQADLSVHGGPDKAVYVYPVAHYSAWQADGFAVVGTANSGLQVEPLVSRTRPDLVLLDLHLPGLDGLSCLALLREQHPEATVVVLSGSEDDEMIEQALSGGAVALVREASAPADLGPPCP